MIVRLPETNETAAMREPSASREAPMMAEHMLGRHERQPLDRRLRSRILIGNAIAWIVIMVLLRMFLF